MYYFKFVDAYIYIYICMYVCMYLYIYVYKDILASLAMRASGGGGGQLASSGTYRECEIY